MLGLWLLFCLLMTCQIASNWVSMFQIYNTCRRHCRYIKLIFHGAANFLWLHNTSAFLVGGINVYLHIFFKALIDLYWKLDWASFRLRELAVSSVSAVLVTQQSKHNRACGWKPSMEFCCGVFLLENFCLDPAPEFWVIEQKWLSIDNFSHVLIIFQGLFQSLLKAYLWKSLLLS